MSPKVRSRYLLPSRTLPTMLDISNLTHLLQDDKNDTEIHDRYLQESLEGRITGKNRKQNTLQATFFFIFLNELCKCTHMLTLLGYFIEIF